MTGPIIRYPLQSRVFVMMFGTAQSPFIAYIGHWHQIDNGSSCDDPLSSCFHPLFGYSSDLDYWYIYHWLNNLNIFLIFVNSLLFSTMILSVECVKIFLAFVHLSESFTLFLHKMFENILRTKNIFIRYCAFTYVDYLKR